MQADEISDERLKASRRGFNSGIFLILLILSSSFIFETGSTQINRTYLLVISSGGCGRIAINRIWSKFASEYDNLNSNFVSFLLDELSLMTISARTYIYGGWGDVVVQSIKPCY